MRWNKVNGKSRWEITKDAVIDVIQNAQDANIGIFNMYQQRADRDPNTYLISANTQPLIAVQDISLIRSQAIAAINNLQPMGLPDIEAQTIYHAARYFSNNAFRNPATPASPITSACQANYLVYSTDGQGDDLTQDMVQEITGNSSCQAFAHHGYPQGGNFDGRACASTVVNWLLNNDQNPDIPGKQTITTHTVGSFGAAVNHLQNIASAGGGQYYDAGNSSSGLKNAFNAIIQQAVVESAVSFTNAAVSINSANLNDDDEDIYYGLFKPEKTDRWAGNVKSYFSTIHPGTGAVTVRSSTAGDTPGTPALDAQGEFADDARSRWSTAADGANISMGGAAFRLPAPASRNLLIQSGNSLQPLATVSAAQLGAASTSERKKLLDYIRGLEDDGVTARKILGDPLHSTPAVVNYSCSSLVAGQCAFAAGERMVLLGSNEGFVHLFDAKTGVEQFAFMPELLLPNIKKLHANAGSSPIGIHPYGMDNTVTVWVNDSNGNGVVYGAPGAAGGLNSGEFIYAYASMRRGGRGLYALDITQKDNPKLLWHIVGGVTPGFERLGQTWSQPVKSKIKLGAVETDVLIFGGGYDAAANDNNAPYRSGTHLGNAIYMVDARTGQRIWWGSANAHAPDGLTLPSMRYSIPARVRVLEKNGLAEQIFVGDTGGQVWRLFIHNGNPAHSLVTAGGQDGVLADLGGSGAANARRFYHEADVVFTEHSGARRISVNIGSGYRAHPLDTQVQDRIYSLQSKQLTAGAEPTITESLLYDASHNTLDGSESAAISALSGKEGWYIRLKKSGEKVLSTALSVGGEVIFNTYVPDIPIPDAAPTCSAAMGGNRTYRLRLRDASPARVLIGTVGSYDDRVTPNNQKGIASTPALLRRGDTLAIIPCLTCEPIVKTRSIANGQLEKTYWMDLQD